MSSNVHETAIVRPGAELGRDVTIGPFAFVDNGVRIGDGCIIGPRVSILSHTSLGNGCVVHTGAVLGDVPQDMAFRDEESYLRIGQNCIIREYVTIHRGTKPKSATEIGDGCFLMGLSHCGHNVKLAANVIVANGALLAGYVEVGERAFISGNCLIHQFTKVGKLAMLGGACGVTKDVPPFCTVAPVSLNEVAGLNVVGMKRAGMNPDERDEVKRGFKILYQSGLNVSQAVKKMQETFKSGPALELCSFVEQSSRGICMFRGN